MKLRCNANKLARSQARRTTAVHAGFVGADTEWGRLLRINAVRNSTGNISSATLRGVRPGLYSRARPAIPEFDAVINEQTGTLARSWRSRTVDSGGSIYTQVINIDPKAKFMLGTTKMRFRGVLKKALRQTPLRSVMLLAAKRRGEGVR
jgi:hypothetical protein